MWVMQMMLKNINITTGFPANFQQLAGNRSIIRQEQRKENFFYCLGLGLCWPVVLNTSLFTFVLIGHFLK